MTASDVVLMMRYHQPYLLLEQMMFYFNFLDGYQAPEHLEAYCDVMQNYYNRSGMFYIKMTTEEPNSIYFF